MTRLYLDALDKPRQALWLKLSAFKAVGVLGGGTAIALQIGHRVSLDFDIFLPEEITSGLRHKAFAVLDRPITAEIDNPELLSLVSRSGLRLTLLAYPYPPLHPLVKTDSLPLFHLADLASNKAYTIGRRGRWRDYVDLYFMLREAHVTLTKTIADSQKRFSDEFSPQLFLEQLAYTKDLGKLEADFLRNSASSTQITKFLEGQVKAYVQSRLFRTP